MKGDTEEAVRAGAHAMFMPHGLGHMMGLDVHDMEGLGQNYVGFDNEVQPSTQFGLNCLRCGRRLQPGFVMTDEPGIYFIPHLIDLWKSQGMHKEFINYDAVEPFRNFGGVRLEDDILITNDGCRILGKDRIPLPSKGHRGLHGAIANAIFAALSSAFRCCVANATYKTTTIMDRETLRKPEALCWREEAFHASPRVVSVTTTQGARCTW